MDKVFVRTGEAAEIAGVTSQTIRRWCQQGHIAFRKTPGGRIQVDRDSLQKIMSAEAFDAHRCEGDVS